MASREDRRLEIINASIRIFGKYGYHKAKIEDIAKAAGVGKGTVYEYFESKKSLFQEMVKYIMNEYRREVEKIFSNDNCIENKLIDFARFQGKCFSQNADIAHTVMNDSNDSTKDMRNWLFEAKSGIAKLIQGLIEESINNGELRKDLDSEIATLSIIGTIFNYYAKKIHIDKINHTDIEPKRVIDTLLRGMK